MISPHKAKALLDIISDPMFKQMLQNAQNSKDKLAEEVFKEWQADDSKKQFEALEREATA